jgi:hypothetical protein
VSAGFGGADTAGAWSATTDRRSAGNVSILSSCGLRWRGGGSARSSRTSAGDVKTRRLGRGERLGRRARKKRTMKRSNPASEQLAKYPALWAWRTELRRGERTRLTFDPLFHAACAEAWAREEPWAEYYREQAARILREAAA